MPVTRREDAGMNWTEQAQEMMKSWTGTQKKLWESWSDAAKSGSAQPSQEPWSGWVAQWQQMARDSLQKMGSGATGVPREVAERLFAGEASFLRFVEFALGTLKHIAPKIDAGEDWVELLRRQLGQMKQEMTKAPAPWFTPEAAAAFSKDIPELWRLFLQETGKLSAPWTSSIKQAGGHIGEAMSGDRQAAIRMYNMFLDTFENTFGKLAAAPAIGYTREFQEKLTKAFESWVDARRAEVDLRTELVNTGLRALEGLLRELVAKGEAGEKVDSFRALFDLWVATAEKSYYDIASTESFAEIQGRVVNTAMQYRIRERELAEEIYRTVHLPTQSELDDAYRHMHDLKSEVRKLRSEVNQLKAAAKSQPAPAPAPQAAATATAPAPKKAPTKASVTAPAKTKAKSAAKAAPKAAPKAAAKTRTKTGRKGS